MNLFVMIEEDDADLLRDLASWLEEDPDLRGRVDLLERAPDPGALGPVTEALQVVLGSGGAGALAGVAIAWLRHRTGDVSVKFTRTRGKVDVEINARRVRELRSTEVDALVRGITLALEQEASSPPDDDAPR
ncbi:hypothetical protein AB0395_03420 [Streptosporangium sp. NPDC051023]|uniref:effector-associated constant component EACC1 n=1 Tax=Streptosporangium sp. NPDC051023 TaxID=3155410 RepID=UPI0034510811